MRMRSPTFEKHNLAFDTMTFEYLLNTDLDGLRGVLARLPNLRELLGQLVDFLSSLVVDLCVVA